MRNFTQKTFGAEAIDPAARQGRINEVFDSIASQYDLMNDLMSGGMHRLWKWELLNWLGSGCIDFSRAA